MVYDDKLSRLIERGEKGGGESRGILELESRSGGLLQIPETPIKGVKGTARGHSIVVNCSHNEAHTSLIKHTPTTTTPTDALSLKMLRHPKSNRKYFDN